MLNMILNAYISVGLAHHGTGYLIDLRDKL